MMLFIERRGGCVAKGNNGNYFQHSVEIALGKHLASADSGRIHACFTHGMGPFEPCEKPAAGQTYKLLNNALARALLPHESIEPPIVTAYRSTKATLQRYPNSAELLAAILGATQITGSIAEVKECKHAALCKRWKGFGIRTVNASWRLQIVAGGALACPSDLAEPWLFSMDPMTYANQGWADDAKLYGQDRKLISDALTNFVRSGQPGVALIFVYAIRPDNRTNFWEFADGIANDCGAAIDFLWQTHQGGNRNLSAVLSSNSALPPQWVPDGINRGRV